MTMKKILLVLTLLISVAAFTQDKHKIRARIKAQKTAFITEQLDLNPEEAEKFWPIYNTFEKQTEDIKYNELRGIKRQIGKNPDMPEAEASKLLEKVITAENQMHKAKQQLLTDLKGVIPSIKILKLKRAEDAFNRKLLERLRKKRKERS
jgi:hypothetical protein